MIICGKNLALCRHPIGWERERSFSILVNAKIYDCSTDIPDGILESLSNLILPDILTYFASEEGQREFAEWQQECQNSKE